MCMYCSPARQVDEALTDREGLKDAVNKALGADNGTAEAAATTTTTTTTTADAAAAAVAPAVPSADAGGAAPPVEEPKVAA